MRDSMGDIQSVLVLGGGSEIALATVDLLVERRCETVILAVRNPAAHEATASELRQRGADVSVVRFDADETEAHANELAAIFAEHGEIDLVLLAFAVLGQPFSIDQDPADAAAVAQTNYVGGVSAALASAQQLKGQGHGTLCVLSSVAGERVRAENAVYGSTKAGLDGFAQALGDELHGTGASVLVVRPGFVHTKMTAGMDAAPFATTPERVAADIVAGIRKSKRIVWSPPVLRGVFSVLRHAPHPLWRLVARSDS